MGALKARTRLVVFAIRQRKHGGTIWTRAGNAFVNDDGSINVHLDVLPMDGRLHCRETVLEMDEVVKAQLNSADPESDLATVQVEGSS